MPQVARSTTITIDEVVYSVEQLSPTIKPLVMLMDDWRQQDADTASSLAMIRAALRDLQNNIVLTMRKERTDAAVILAQKGLEPDPAAVTDGPVPAETAASANDESAG